MRYMPQSSIRFIVVHHSLTADGRVLDFPAIRRYHKHHHGWEDIGYHIVLEEAPLGSRVALIGRPWVYQGAHARGVNGQSLGLCLVGNFDEGPPSETAWRSLVDMVRWLTLWLDLPESAVLGHREVQQNRTCPGRFLDMDRLRAALIRRR